MGNLALILEILYILIVIGVAVKVVYDTHDPVKTLGYLIFVVLVPIIGILFYFSFGVNYRKQKLYSKKVISNENFFHTVKRRTHDASLELMEQEKQLLGNMIGVTKMMLSRTWSFLSRVEDLKLLVNGEAKFPAVIEALETAKKSIHIEYYIYSNDEIGKRIKDILIKKSLEGVQVRFIYDDFGSRSLNRRMEKELRKAGVEVFPFYKIWVLLLASRMNYRNHRKIIVIDGELGFIGGLNIDDRYTNSGKYKLYWRDTHLMLKGVAAISLQAVFLSDWNFCAQQHLEFDERFFSENIDQNKNARPHSLVQIIESGPDSKLAYIMLANMGAFSSATKRLYISTPYFVPNESVMNSLKFAALKGVDVRLLVPGTSDSHIVNAASRSNYQELLEVGVRIYLYWKGFMHAKTTVVDDNLSIIGSANMDIRSYDLDFEANALVYDRQLNKELAKVFMNDLKECTELNITDWGNRSKWTKFGDTVARLLSPLL
jgi:cardiolipin synthase